LHCEMSASDPKADIAPMYSISVFDSKQTQLARRLSRLLAPI
jgi:hypothetical protein